MLPYDNITVPTYLHQDANLSRLITLLNKKNPHLKNVTIKVKKTIATSNQLNIAIL